MYRILIGGLRHETNTFCPFPTTRQDFYDRMYIPAENLIEKSAGSKSVIGAFLEVLDRWGDVEPIPSCFTFAMPFGTVTDDAYRCFSDELIAPIEREKPDAVLLSLHGAMCTEKYDDGEGYVVERIRNIVGPDVPIAIELDLHANVSERMVKNADILIPYDNYPHNDSYDKALITAELLMKTLHGEIKPCLAFSRAPILSTLKETFLDDYKPVRDAVSAARQIPGVLHAGITHGFFLTDVEENHPCSLVVTDGNPALAQKIADDLKNTVWENREAMTYFEPYTVTQAYGLAVKEGKFPVAFGDVCDNPGAGGTCDSVDIIRSLLAIKAEKVAVALIFDSETVDACMKAGVGATIPVKLGGKICPERTGGPLEAMAYIKSLHDGDYVNCGAMLNGTHNNLFGSAVIQIEGITVIVGRGKPQPYDINAFRSHGIIMEDYNVLVVKSSIHYKAMIGQKCHKCYGVLAKGMYTLNFNDLPYKKLLPGTYPLN